MKRIFFFVRMILAVAVMWWLLRKINIDWTQFSLPQILVGIFGAASCIIAMIAVTSLRWKMLMNSGGLNVSFWVCFKNNMIGAFFNSFVPSGFGGDVVRTINLSKDMKVSSSRLAGGVMIDRIYGFMGLILAFWSFYFLRPEPTLGSLFLSVTLFFCVGFIALVLAVRFQRFVHILGQKISNKYLKWIYSVYLQTSEDMKSFHVFSLKFAWVILLSVIGNIFYVGSYYCTVGVLDISGLDFINTGLASMVNQMALLIPATPGGVGYGQVTLSYFYSLFGEEFRSVGVVSMTMLQVASFSVAGVGGLFLVFKGNENEKLNS